MNRFERVLSLPSTQPALAEVVQFLAQAIAEAEAESVNPIHDAAIVMLAASVAFQVNADVIGPGVRQQLMSLCEYHAEQKRLLHSSLS